MEKIYTIPVNEAFEQNDVCPFCLLYKKLESNELDLVLGASMMEPDVRIETNKIGFCATHYGKMFNLGNRLGLALMLESHLDIVKDAAKIGTISILKDKITKITDETDKINDSCYVCSRIEKNFSKMFETSSILWESDGEFRKKFAAQSHFCLVHYTKMLKIAKLFINKKRQPDFLEAAALIEEPYMDKIKKNISFFCKKFDYRYADEPWGDSKDAVEKAIKFLEGDNAIL